MTPRRLSTGTICCPECDWAFQHKDNKTARLSAEVEAEIHWDSEHSGLIPDSADFGDHQCPECLDVTGMDGTVSCQECGHIPEEVRA